jgi:hypothetical protein
VNVGRLHADRASEIGLRNGPIAAERHDRSRLHGRNSECFEARRGVRLGDCIGAPQQMPHAVLGIEINF